MSRGFFLRGAFFGDDMVSTSLQPEPWRASELQMERSINLEELESSVGKCHRRRLECIIFVNRVEVDKSDLLLQDEWMEAIA